MGIGITGHVPALNEIDAKEKSSFEKSLHYMGIEPGAKMKGKKVDYVFIGSCNQCPHRRLKYGSLIVKGKT
jgi:3-isopropylmalate/(R)-2-methylmalate dehydratase large subunit